MTDSNTPKRSGRPRRNGPSTRHEWIRLVANIEPEQSDWLDRHGEKGKHIRAILDYMMEHPEVHQQITNTV